MIILAIVEFIIILLLIFLRKRILIAIALIKEASRSARAEHLFQTFKYKEFVVNQVYCKLFGFMCWFKRTILFNTVE